MAPPDYIASQHPSSKLTELIAFQIQGLDASVSHLYSDLYKNEKVPTFDEAVKGALDLGLKLILDIKEYDDRALNYLVQLFEKYPNLKDEAIVSSFYPQVILVDVLCPPSRLEVKSVRSSLMQSLNM